MNLDFFFFKQKTAYEIKECDWSSDVCSSDLKKLLAFAEKKEKNFYAKFLVYKSFREQGYCPKTGFKFGADFRVYPKGKKPGKAHTKWVVNVVLQSKRISMTELNRMVRLSKNIRTELLLAVVDSENGINFYSVARIML